MYVYLFVDQRCDLLFYINATFVQFFDEKRFIFNFNQWTYSHKAWFFWERWSKVHQTLLVAPVKNQSHTARQTRYIQEKMNFLILWGSQIHKSCWKVLIKPYFMGSKLLSNTSRKFSNHPMMLFKVFQRSTWSCSLRQ